METATSTDSMTVKSDKPFPLTFEATNVKVVRMFQTERFPNGVLAWSATITTKRGASLERTFPKIIFVENPEVAVVVLGIDKSDGLVSVLQPKWREEQKAFIDFIRSEPNPDCMNGLKAVEAFIEARDKEARH